MEKKTQILLSPHHDLQQIVEVFSVTGKHKGNEFYSPQRGEKSLRYWTVVQDVILVISWWTVPGGIVEQVV